LWFANKADAQWTYRDLCINRNNHQKPTFHPLGDFLNPALALLGQGSKPSADGLWGWYLLIGDKTQSLVFGNMNNIV
jgi:hypothetical protein